MEKISVTVVQNNTINHEIELMHWWCAKENNNLYTTTLGKLSIDLSLLHHENAVCSECGKGLGSQR